MALRPYASPAPAEAVAEAPTTTDPAASSARAEAKRRLQIGFSALAGVMLLVSLSSVIMERANRADAAAVPEAAATVAPTPSPAGDPLADTGVVPDLPLGGAGNDGGAGTAPSTPGDPLAAPAGEPAR